MGSTSNDRVIALLKTLKIDEMEASRRIGKQASTFYRITNKVHEPTKTTLRIIAEGLGASYDWLLTGRGEMLVEKIEGKEMKISNPWREEAYKALKDEVAFYRQLLLNGNFLNPHNETGAIVIDLQKTHCEEKISA